MGSADMSSRLAVFLRLIILASTTMGIRGNICKESLEITNDFIMMNVNCSTAKVSWTANPYAGDIVVAYECGDGPLKILLEAGDTLKSSVAAPINLTLTQLCVFRICYRNLETSNNYQARPENCIYTGLPVTTASSSKAQTTTTHDMTQTLNSSVVSRKTSYATPVTTASSSKAQMTTTHDTRQTLNSSVVSRKTSYATSASVASIPSPVSAGTFIIVLSTLGIIVLIFVCVSLFSVMLTLKIKRSVRFSKGINKMNIISEEEVFVKGFDIVYKGRIGSCTSLVTVIQPLQKEQVVLNAASTPDVYARDNAEVQDQSVGSTGMMFLSELEKTPLPAKQFDIAEILPELHDDSGYIENSDRYSDQYLSFHSSYSYTKANAFETEIYDEFSLCSQ